MNPMQRTYKNISDSISSIGKFFWPALAVVAFAMFIFACKPIENPPANPYDNVDYGNDTNSIPQPDPNSIIGIHENILKVKCNNPGCHDGTFEPDFRTIQSAYSTLVYHRIVKNDSFGNYTFRVTPHDTSTSMIIRRLTRDDAQLQRMPATGAYLTSSELQNIINWINAGCPDMFGELPVLPNGEPVFLGTLAFDSAFSRIDTNRVNDDPINSFIADFNTQVQLVFLTSDDSTSVQNMQVNTIKFSYDMNDFTGAATQQAFYMNLGGFELHLATFNTNVFLSDSTVYFRYYFNDGDHPADSEFPTDAMFEGYKTYSSMYIKP